VSFNLAIVLRESARSNPEKPAVIHEDGSLTYGELDRLSDLVAANLAQGEVGPGDAVGLQLPNVPEFVVALYGILKAGAVAVPMNILNKAPEVEFFMTDARAQAMITSAESGDEGVRGAKLAGVKLVYHLPGPTKGDRPTKVQPFSALLCEDVPSPAPYIQRDPGDPAVLLYTSGTTGRPKGVELTHFQLFMNATAHIDGFEMSSDTTVIAVMPLFHALGLSGILNATISKGGTVVLVKRFDPEKVLEAIEVNKATLLHGVPTMYHALLNHPRRAEFDTSSLEVCGSAGAPIAAELLDTFEREFGVVILEAYGLTESGPVATFNRRNNRKPYSIGTPVWGVEMQVWDDDHNVLPRGPLHIGELVIRGHNTMRGYLNNPQATEEAFAGGWLHTGDLGYQDDDGFFFIVDRKKELIIRGGYNVYPREVEEVFYNHTAVDEVAVVGVPDERLGEEVKAYVTLKPGADADELELIEFVKARVAAYKYPRIIEIIGELPKGPTGKILKKELAHS
jgi:long-chain acyl-CoA synthetase